MVDPLVIAGGATAAYLLLKPKEQTPEEAQEQIDEMPQEQLEEQVPPAVTVTPAPSIVDPAPAPKTCVLVKRPKREIPMPPQVENYYRKEKEVKSKLSVELKAAEIKFSESLKGFSYRDARILVYSPRSTTPSRWGGKSVPEHAAERLGLTIDEITVALKATEEVIITAAAKARDEKLQLYQKAHPFLKAWDVEKQKAEAAAGAEFQAMIQEYESRGWNIHRVKIQAMPDTPNWKAQMGTPPATRIITPLPTEEPSVDQKPKILGRGRFVIYACPPGVEPEVFG